MRAVAGWENLKPKYYRNTQRNAMMRVMIIEKSGSETLAGYGMGKMKGNFLGIADALFHVLL